MTDCDFYHCNKLNKNVIKYHKAPGYTEENGVTYHSSVKAWKNHMLSNSYSGFFFFFFYNSI